MEISRGTFQSVLKLMKKMPDLRYTQSQAQIYRWIEEKYPALFAKIRAQVKAGRWEVIGGMWTEPDCNLIDVESFIRQVLYGKRYFKEKFGQNVDIAWNVDSFGYNWQMPQFLQGSGITNFVTQKIGWNDTNIFPYHLFWWEGPDGSKVLTYFPYNPTSALRQFSSGSPTEELEKVSVTHFDLEKCLSVGSECL
ncbi:hypothetical protein LR007_01635 [candidate division NPL-UPA2 bacterium]|nr:hypothetical protein [candidate division NPL-UPA2 bacterium]